MSQSLDSTVAVIGIDIGKNSFHIVVSMSAVQSFCARSGRVARSKRGSPTCRRA